MHNLYIPLCSLVLNVFLIVLYLAKASKTKEENNYYFGMVIDTFLMTIFCIIAVYLLALDTNRHDIVKLTNRLECVFIVNFFSNLIMYVLYISDNRKEIYTKLYIFTNLLAGILIFTTPVILEYTNDKNYMVSVGLSVDITTMFSVGLLVSTFIVAFRNRDKLKEKIIPVNFLLIFIVMVLIIRGTIPEFICLEFLATVATLIMYHTIENPDIKTIVALNVAKSEAERANMAKSDFLSSMSHEIRTPLNAIVGLSEDIVDRDDIPEVIKEDAQDIVYASNTLLEIVGNIIDINKIENQKVEIIEIPYDLRKEIEEIIKINRTRIGEKNIRIITEISPDLPYEILGDKPHIKQIINNLISNAIKYTDQGEIKISVKSINTNNQCYLIITVQDTGRGIKAEDIQKLFTKFERLDVAKNSTTEGTGLGLAITKQLVDLLGGKINIQSKYGTGSIFVVQIPQKIGIMTDPMEHLPMNVKEEKNINDYDYSNKKVLIVDDNKLNIKVAKRTLSSFNLIIDECDNGQQCLDLINRGNNYDLILMDIMMPIMSGETALEKLKEIPNFNTPVIALTADAFDGAKEKYLHQGFVDYLSKPFSKEQIMVMLINIFK